MTKDEIKRDIMKYRTDLSKREQERLVRQIYIEKLLQQGALTCLLSAVAIVLSLVALLK